MTTQMIFLTYENSCLTPIDNFSAIAMLSWGFPIIANLAPTYFIEDRVNENGFSRDFMRWILCL